MSQGTATVTLVNNTGATIAAGIIYFNQDSPSGDGMEGFTQVLSFTNLAPNATSPSGTVAAGVGVHNYWAGILYTDQAYFLTGGFIVSPYKECGLQRGSDGVRLTVSALASDGYPIVIQTGITIRDSCDSYFQTNPGVNGQSIVQGMLQDVQNLMNPTGTAAHT